MAYLQIFVVAALSVAVLAQDCDPANCPACDHGSPFCDHHGTCHCNNHNKRATCTDNSDCSGKTCDHGEYAACQVLHGSGGGSGEKGCVCVHHKRALTQVCQTATDCSSWGSSNCGHGEKVGCELNHGSGSGSGEYNCVCKSHKRAVGCCQASDCDATALGCAHNQVATCEIAHGSGHGCGENVCKCVSKH